ncbi:MAG: autotransporter outer membrane beta-barrel domain-containing protein [Hyphomicrobiaceae bacterium]|nr:autotransporter outer membrane beta-barrel domain-containing protein [Hyphomicrobiaceae bacterium]
MTHVPLPHADPRQIGNKQEQNIVHSVAASTQPVAATIDKVLVLIIDRLAGCVMRVRHLLSRFTSLGLGLALLFTADAARAQSQFSAVTSQATGVSAQGNIEAFQNDMIEAVGIGPAGSGATRTLGPAAVGGVRLRSTSHSGFTSTPALFPPATVTYGADIRESTVYAAASMPVPNTMMGGRMRFGVMLGKTFMDIEAKPNSQLLLPLKGQIGSAKVDNTILGASVVWSGAPGYISAAGIFTFGETDMTDKFACCVGDKYKEKHSGFTGSLTAGRVFPLTTDANGLRLDLRGSLGYTNTKGDPFDVSNGAPIAFYDSFNYSTAWVSFAPMLFADIATSGGRVRPYVQASLKHLFNHSNRSQFSGPLILDPGTDYTEGNRVVTVEAGLNASFGNWSLGASIYRENSANYGTTGGKIGATYNFN